MLIHKLSPLCLILEVCKYISNLIAGIQYILLKIEAINGPSYLVPYKSKRIKKLRGIWYARISRRIVSALLRTPFRKDILKLVNIDAAIKNEKGCIIVICHTPWKRLLIQWCVENKFALLIGGGDWKDNRRIIQRRASGITGIRELVRHLHQQGKIITVADVFNDLKNCPVTFLGKQHNASLFTERLAVLSKVPVIAAVPSLNKQSFELIIGPIFHQEQLFRKTTLTQKIISFFEKEIEDNPAVWPEYVK